MNKAANPKQLDLAGDLPPERIAAKEVLASASAILAQAADPDEFDWNTDESIILREQRATAAYRNRLGELIIRQRAGWSDDGDSSYTSRQRTKSPSWKGSPSERGSRP
jgi:hypothetical protein